VASVREASAIAKKSLALRDHLWPQCEEHLWHRLANKGFATIPKTMPFILKIMDEMTKGAPVSSTYLALWCWTWDNSYVSISNPAELSQAAGFGGQRGVHTWAGRMKKLQELNFIAFKPGKSGPMSHVIIWNPHKVVRWHHDVQQTPGLMEASFTSLIERAAEIGALDMLAPLQAPGNSVQAPAAGSAGPAAAGLPPLI
jgi:hypothetical protein